MFQKFSFLMLLTLLSEGCKSQEACLSRDYGYGSTVCVCNSEQCDTVPKPEKLEAPQYLVYTSNKAGLRFEKKAGEFDQETSEYTININSSVTYQTILGFGGAFTDSTGININSLEEILQDKLLASYFSEDGIEYNIGRVPIGGTDFSTHGYSYDDGEEDKELLRFDLAEEDHLYKIPYIKQAQEISNNNLKLFASAWIAPKWMKSNGEYSGFGFLKEDMYQSWADYFVKFLDSYKSQEVLFWGITTGNEPLTILVPGNQIPIVGWNSTEMGRWIRENLGPTIRSSDHSNISIMALDDQRIYLPFFVEEALVNETARDYIQGFGIHWYLDLVSSPRVLDETHTLFPEKYILATEACNGVEAGIGPVVLGSWERGEGYSIDIIQDLQHWVAGWVDWNIALDTAGGPTYISNFVDAPIIVNASGGEFYKQPMFYHLGHFSKFIPENSVRIEHDSNLDESVMIVAFQRPDNGISVVILNRNDTVTVSLTDETRGTALLELSERSITTILYW